MKNAQNAGELTQKLPPKDLGTDKYGRYKGWQIRLAKVLNGRYKDWWRAIYYKIDGDQATFRTEAHPDADDAMIQAMNEINKQIGDYPKQKNSLLDAVMNGDEQAQDEWLKRAESGEPMRIT